jgi:trehalose-6-phosphatase
MRVVTDHWGSRSYSDRTDGAYIEIKESALVWHYENADPEYGKSQASELAKYTEKVNLPLSSSMLTMA